MTIKCSNVRKALHIVLIDHSVANDGRVGSI
jgi:hypothetical protein